MIRRTVTAAAIGLAFAGVVAFSTDPTPAAAQFGKFKKAQKKDDAKAAPKADPKPVAADDRPIPADQLAFFEKKIRPVLIDKCQSCHTADTPKGPKGGLTVDTRNGLLLGGDTGAAVVPNDLKKSLLLKAVHGDGLAQMPPKEKLSADAVADFEKWIKMGAPDPRTGKPTAGKPKPIDIARGKEHWAFQPVRPVPPPVNREATPSANPIDAYVAEKLAAQKLTPSPEADKRTLLRRAFFDLIGLPPTPDEIDQFVKDTSPDAFAKVVDRLLARPQFGEKWGRHWLDVARYAESTGKELNTLYPHAWRYRDYVIAAYNADKPVDQFFREQLAGDLLSHKDDAEKAEHLTATGYLAIGPKSVNERNPRQFQMDLADEQIDAFTQGMLGLTVACARCHDHKFDPIPTRDYYALAGIFTSSETRFGTAAGIQARQSAPLTELPAAAPAGDPLSKAEIERLKTRLADLKKQREDAQAAAAKDRTQPPLRLLVVNTQIGILDKQLANFDADGNPKRMAMTVQDRTFPRDVPVLARGELDKPGETAPRGVPQVLAAKPVSIRRGESGRKELAEWVASADNPLTARVYVNRVWQHLFGKGLVTSPDNFGTTGTPPSHPTLLDFLAADFTKAGWRTKKLIRQLVLSRTYRQASAPVDANLAADPDNTYLWRMSKRRLDAEAIRDSMLAISGQLDDKPANGSPLQKAEGPVQALARYGMTMTKPEDTAKRSVYIPIIRDQVPEVLELFDFPDPSLVSGSRDSTSVPAQALYLMNNPQAMKLAEKTGEALQKKYLSDTERIDAAFKQAFGRAAKEAEVKAAQGFIEKFTTAETKGSRRKADVEKAAWAAFAQALFAAAEFRYLD